MDNSEYQSYLNRIREMQKNAELDPTKVLVLHMQLSVLQFVEEIQKTGETVDRNWFERQLQQITKT